MRIVIVGGVAGGMSCATRLRRLNEDAEIIVLDKGDYVSFANCGLPYYIGGEIEDRSSLLVQTPSSLKARFNLDIRLRQEVVGIDEEHKEIKIHTEKEEYSLSYDKLVLSLGAKAIAPYIANQEHYNHLFHVKTIGDVDAIQACIESKQVRHAVVVGGGFIGLEMVENLVKRNIKVTLVEKGHQVLAPLDQEMALYMEEELKKHGVQVLKNTSITEIQSETHVVLEGGQALEAELIVLAIGVVPDTAFLKETKIKLAKRGGILVDEHFQTSVKDVYAVGDAIVVKHVISKEEVMIALASPANRQGRHVADILSGLQRTDKGSLGTSIVRAFDLVVASTGLNEKQLMRQGQSFGVVHVRGKSHASYYPHSKEILLKLIFDPIKGTIFGAQALGEDGVDKRIDVLSTAIKGNLSVFDLCELELSYSPPFGSAKDIVNMAGYVAMNQMEGLSPSIQWHELDQQINVQKIDVRSVEEYKQGYMEGFVNIPLDELRGRLKELNKDKEIIVSCLSGQRSYIAQRILMQLGYQVKNLDGAYALYAHSKPDQIVKAKR